MGFFDAKVLLIDPLGRSKKFLKHKHYLRDWSGTYIAGYVPFPPLDLISAAAYVRKHGFTVAVIEASIRHWTNSKVAEIIRKSQAEFVLIPSAYFSLDDDRDLAARIKAVKPQCTIIFSGPALTTDPSIILQDWNCDFVALGELELPLLAIVCGDYSHNVAYRKDGKIVCAKRTLLDLAELPLPARDLIDNNAYRYAIFNRRNPVTSMILTRGCKHGKCTFCQGNVFALGQVRCRQIADIERELTDIYCNYGIKEIFFRDQSFTNDRELVVRVCEYIIAQKFDLVWRANTRVDLLDEELLIVMKKAGCYQLSLGIESASQYVLDVLNKGITLDQVRSIVQYAKDLGIEILGNFMLGCPGDTEESMNALCDYALSLNVDYVNMNKFCLISGIDDYTEFKKGKLTLPPNDLVERILKRSFLRFHFRPRFLLHQLKRIRSLSDLFFLIQMGLNMFLTHFSSFWKKLRVEKNN
jgi:radical SAM superfamily enzyme YgiQ (UPF0313 family)